MDITGNVDNDNSITVNEGSIMINQLVLLLLLGVVVVVVFAGMIIIIVIDWLRGVFFLAR